MTEPFEDHLLAEDDGDDDALLVDPHAELPGMRAVLNAYGVGNAEIDRAEHDGTLVYLAMDRLIFPDPPIYDLPALAEVTGLPWTEIDFAEDVRRAQTAIFPHLIDIAAPAALAVGALGR